MTPEERDVAQDLNYEAFKAEEKSLFEDYGNKSVLYKDGNRLGIFNSDMEAVESVGAIFFKEGYSVHLIGQSLEYAGCLAYGVYT